MPVFRSGDEVYQTEGSEIIWSTTRAPVLLVPGQATTLSSFDIAFPDFVKDNAYGLDVSTGIVTRTGCATFSSIAPQEWDSGLGGPIATLPAGANHFEIEVELTRVFNPSTYLGVQFPKSLAEGHRTWLNGGSCEVERIGPIIRIFRFERSGNSIYLRRKQSVRDSGNQHIWTPGNTQYSGSGGYLEGWTYGSNPKAWPAFLLDAKAGGNINKRRGEVNACSLVDTTNFASVWRGTVIITPGHIKP